MKLFCLPCAGASATMYWRWKTQVPAWLDIVPVELAGRGERIAEDHHERFDAQLSDVFQLNHKFFKGSYAIFGHSMGGLLTYALALKLMQKKLPLPKALIISACPAPSSRDTSRFDDLDDASLIEDLKSQNGTPPMLFEHPELLQMTLQNLRSDYKVCADFQYEPNKRVSMPIHVLAGKQDDIAQEDVIPWQKESRFEATFDWFDGDHFYLQPSQCEQAMLQTLVQKLGAYQ